MAFEVESRGRLASQINVTPLVDVMLVLLVIFMVTAPILQQGVEVNLPRVRAAALPGEEQQFVVSITRGGEIYLNDARLDREALTDKLKAIAVERPDRQVFIRADSEVPYGDVIGTMAAIKAAGIENVGMVTEMPAAGAGARVGRVVANRDPDGAEHSRAGYIAAIIVSALGHAAVVAVVVWVIPQLLQSHFTAPPAYTVKIVDSLPAGDLGTHLPRLDTRAEEEQQKEPPKVAPPLSEPLAPPEDKSALALNSVATPTPTIPAPEPTAIATIAPTVAATITPTEAPTPIAMKTTAIKPRVKPQPAAAPSSEIARATRTPSVAERLAALKAQMLAEHLAETAKDNGEATDDQSKSSAEPSGGGPIAANKASAGMGAGIGPGTGSSGIQQDLDFLLYYRTVQESIKKAWSFSGGNPELQTVVNFAIAADGALTGVKIAQSSHDSAFDESVVRAIRKAAPFPAPPEKYRAQFAGGIEAMFKLGELSS